MPRDRYDDEEDEEDDRPQRRSRRFDDDDSDRPRRRDDREPRKSNVKVILAIVFCVLFLIVVGCGIAGLLWINASHNNRVAYRAASDASDVGLRFIASLGTADDEEAYSTLTTARFRSDNPLPAFKKMVASNPAFQNQDTRIDTNWKLKPTGSPPNRIYSPTYRVRGSAVIGQSREIEVQMTLVEGPEDIWKVDTMTVIQ